MNTSHCFRCKQVLEKEQRKKCSACKLAVYCSRQCQKSHWPQHKKACAREVRPSAATSTFSGDSIAQEGGRPPPKSSLPVGLKHYSWTASADGANSNLLLMFHGLGDDETQYAKLGKQMKLPQTAVMSVRAPIALPFGLPGYAWFPAFEEDGRLIEASKHEKRRLHGLKKTRKLLGQLIQVLVSESSWAMERIFLMGFSAGAIVAVDLATHIPGGRFGGVVAISSSLLPEALRQEGDATCNRASETPMLVTHGTKDKTLLLSSAQEHVQLLRAQGVEVTWKTYAKGHSMICSQAESKDVLKFFSDNFHLRQLALERDPDVIQISGDVVVEKIE